jgi:hypothetical protein
MDINIDTSDAIKNAFITLFSFLIFGFFKLIPFLVAGLASYKNMDVVFSVSCIVASLTLILLGSIKS